MSSIYNKSQDRISNIKSLILNGGNNSKNITKSKNIKLSSLGKLFSSFENDLSERRNMNKKKFSFLKKTNTCNTTRDDQAGNIQKVGKILYIHNNIENKSLSKEKKENNLSFNKNKLITVNKIDNIRKNKNLFNIYKNQCQGQRPLSAFSVCKLQKLKLLGYKDNNNKNKFINKCFKKQNIKLERSRNIKGNTIIPDNNSHDNKFHHLTQRNTYFKRNKIVKNKTKDRIVKTSRNNYFSISSRKLNTSSLNKRQNDNSSKEEENILLYNTYDEKMQINKEKNNNYNNRKTTYNTKKKCVVSLIKQTKKLINKTLPDRDKILDSVRINKFNSSNFFKPKSKQKISSTFFKIPLEKRQKFKNKLNNSITTLKTKNNNISLDIKAKKIQNIKNKIYAKNKIINRKNICNISNNEEGINTILSNSIINTESINQNLLFSPTTSITKENTISIKDNIIKKIMKIDSCTIAGYSSPGIQKINQDNFFIIKEFLDEQEQFFLGVCDGHGTNGHLVSEYITKTLPDYLQDTSDESIINTFISTNDSLINNSKIDCSLSGSTCTTLIINLEKIICANLGDSRAVLAKYEKGAYNAIDLSRDHKPSDPDEMKRILLKGGRIRPFYDEELKKYLGPERVWLNNSDIPGLAMTRSLGDKVAHSVGVISEPEIRKYEFNGNEKFIILASDGIWEYIDSDECVNIVKDFYENDMDAIGALNSLVKQAFNRWKSMEESIDDITAIIIFFE
jgi:serine/threonine protein phosphatase PrpC